MVKFVLDADGAIKLAKATVLENLASCIKCFMPKPAYNEVLVGKEKLYEDAFTIENLAKKEKIKVLNIEIKEEDGFGAGEHGTLLLFHKLKADAIISDDRKFLSNLEKNNIPFVIPSDIIVMLVMMEKISKKEAMEALDKIRNLIREDNYDSAKENIGGL